LKKPRLTPGLIQWAESRGGQVFLHASPIDVAAILQDKLYDRIGPVVYTSATLAVGNSLDYFERRAGLSDDSGPLFPLDSQILASPFDYESHAALYLPKQMPDPQDPAFVQAVADELRKLLPITGGRAFALFTSLRNMRAVHALLAPELPYQVLLQGDQPKAQLLKRFREKPSVLFASQSFWEGVDVQGDTLSLVVNRQAALRPAGRAAGGRAHRPHAHPGRRCVLRLPGPTGGAGLEAGLRPAHPQRDRSRHRRRADARMTRKGYGRIFVDSLPKCRVLREPTEALAFWKQAKSG